MRIEKIRVEGFRLLSDVELTLEPKSTVIVGRNNSGKTSLTDVFDLFTAETNPRFRLEDFSAGNRKKFFEAKRLYDEAAAPDKVLAALPKIATTLTFNYDKAAADLGPLSPFIIDLDSDCTVAIARVEYAATLDKLDLLLGPTVAEGAHC